MAIHGLQELENAEIRIMVYENNARAVVWGTRDFLEEFGRNKNVDLHDHHVSAQTNRGNIMISKGKAGHKAADFLEKPFFTTGLQCPIAAVNISNAPCTHDVCSSNAVIKLESDIHLALIYIETPVITEDSV